jgi:Beta-propeller repeat
MLTRSIALLSLLTLCLTTSNSYSGLKSSVGVQSEIVTSLQSESHGKGAFTRNMGQWEEDVLFQSFGGGATIWICRDRILYQFSRPIAGGETPDASLQPERLTPYAAIPKTMYEHLTVTARLVNALPSVTASGVGSSTHPTNYFIGNDKSKWRSNVPSYHGAILRGVYEDVDFSFSVSNGELKCEMIALTENALSEVQIEYEGVNAINIGADKIATVSTKFGEFAFEGLILKTPEPTSKTTRIAASASSNAALMYSTYLGGTLNDAASDVTIDADGNTYIVGATVSVDFPTDSQFQALSGESDIFVTKLNAAGDDIVFTTFIGGGKSDQSGGIAIDISGNIYVNGATYSNDFPTLNPYQGTHSDVFTDGIIYNTDGCVTKLSSDGSQLLYSTYLGGWYPDVCTDILVDDAGNCYVGGLTYAANFPPALFPSPFHASIPVAVGGYDGFVTKFNATGEDVLFSIYVGGSLDDEIADIDLDNDGNVWITGTTSSRNFPTVNPFQAYINGPAGTDLPDAFVTKISSAGTTFLYSTYLGGLSTDYGRQIVVNGNGVYVAGATKSIDFPTLNPIQFDQAYSDIFVTKLTLDGGALEYSTYVGGNSTDDLICLAVDLHGEAFIAGYTYSGNFPVRFPFQSALAYPGRQDGYFARISASGDRIRVSSFLGGNEHDAVVAIAVDNTGIATLVGSTLSMTDFPIYNAIQPTGGSPGLQDAFVTRLSTNYTGCCIGTRGNANGDASDLVNVVDLTFTVQYLFSGGSSPTCFDEADVNGSGSTNVVDLTALVSFLFASGPTPVACW